MVGLVSSNKIHKIFTEVNCEFYCSVSFCRYFFSFFSLKDPKRTHKHINLSDISFHW